MKYSLKQRLVRVADAINLLRYYKEIVEEMAHFSDLWNTISAEMKAGLDNGDVEKLSRAIIKNRKAAESMNYVLSRYERILQNAGDKSNES